MRQQSIKNLLEQENIHLCRYCMEREGLEFSKTKASGTSCSLCGGLLSGLNSVVSSAIEKVSEYEFATFLVGATLPQSILDGEDEVRSLLKIKGRENIKTQITRIISRKIESATGKRVEYSRPDITMLVSLADDNVAINPRSIWLGASYKKTTRGIPQRTSICRVCNGLGCAECNYSGKKGSSVQSIATAYFTDLFEAESCNFVWLGSEDENSLVGGEGRPFFAEVVHPKKRSFPSRKTKSKKRSRAKAYQKDGVEITKIGLLKSKPTNIPQFEVVVKVYLKKENTAEGTLRTNEIQNMFNDIYVSVRLSRKYRTVQRKIHSIEAKEEGQTSAILLVRCDGGIPLKKLVTGQDDTVRPNLAPFVHPYRVDADAPFDILNVKAKPGTSGGLRFNEDPLNSIDDQVTSNREADSSYVSHESMHYE